MNKEKINISIVLANLSAGGAERVLSFVAQELNKDKFNCTLVIIGHKKDAAYNLKGIEVVYFEKPRVLSGIPKLFSYLLRKKPDIVVSAVSHLNTVVAYMSIFFSKPKFIAREVTILSVAREVNKTKKSMFSRIEEGRFGYFDRIICQSKAMYDDINKHSKIDQSKFVIINNPITDGFDLKKTKKPKEKVNLITVGSFKKIKGHERIIRSLAKLNFPFHFTLIGDGSEKENIFNLIEELGLKDKITHIPFTKDVNKYLADSDLFLQGSYTEGFPNALIESCSVGVPVLAFAAPGGHNEIIIEGVNGYLLETEEDYIKKLEQLNKDYHFDINKVRESSVSRYSKEIIIKKYETLFEDVIKN